MLKFTAPITLDAAAGDGTPKRTITGIAVPYGVSATVTDGTEVRFEKGALPTEGKAPKLFLYHDATQPVGLVTERVDTEEGMLFSAKIAATAAGDEALTLAMEGVLDSVSVGVNPTKFKYDDNGVMVITAADWLELSMVPVPAFSGAAITEVAAAAEEIPTETPDVAIVTDEATPKEIEVSESPAVIEASSVAPVVFAQPKSRRMPSVGEYITKLKAGGAEFAQFNANLAADIQAATGDVVVSDAAGVVPVPILGPVFDDINPLRPITGALGVKAMPEAGATFIRPYVKVHSAVGEQSSELGNLANADFEVDDLVVTKKTFGGRLYLSEQVIDWSAPSMLDQAISDLAAQYALATEKHVVDTLAAAITNTQEEGTDLTDAEAVVENLYLAAASIATVGNYLPNAAVVSPAVWAKLGALKDGDNRPLFPISGPVNSAGNLPQGVTGWNGNILGLTVVVSNQVKDQAVGNKDANEYIWLMNTRGVEVYEQRKGLLRLENPDQLGVRIAFRGYFAAKVVDVNMIRILGPDATF